MSSSSPIKRFPFASYLSSTRALIAVFEEALPVNTAAMKASGVNAEPEAF